MNLLMLLMTEKHLRNAIEALVVELLFTKQTAMTLPLYVDMRVIKEQNRRSSRKN